MAQQVGEIYYNCTIETKDAIAGMRKAETQADSLGSSLKSLSTIASAVAGAFAVNKIIAYADAWATVNNKMANSIKIGETQADVTERVYQVALRSRSSLETTADLYQRLENNARKYVTSGYDVGRITETINKAMIVSGATTAEAAGAIIQLSQGLAEGALRGEDFNSVNSAAPSIIAAIAKVMGEEKEAMRGVAETGKITTDVVLQAIKAMETDVDAKFAKLVPTFAQNLEQAETQLTKFIGSSSVVQSTVAAVGNAFVVVTANLDTFMDVAGLVASVIVGKAMPAIISYTGALAGQISATKTKIMADLESAKSTLAVAVAEKDAASAFLAEASAAAASAQANYAVVASKKADISATLSQLEAERATEVIRLQAQISDQGRTKSLQRLAVIRRDEIALSGLMAKAEAEEAAASIALGNANRAQMAASSSLAAASAGVATAQTAMAKAGGIAAITMRGLSAALALLGGPVGIITTVITGLALFSLTSGKAKDAALDLSGGIEKLKDEYTKLSKVQSEAELSKVAIAQRQIKSEIEAQQKALVGLERTQAAANAGYALDVKYGKASAEATLKQKQASEAVAIARGEIEASQKKLNDLIELEAMLRKQASGATGGPAKVDETKYLQQYDERKKAIAEVNAWEQKELAKNAAMQGISEKTRADAAVLIQKQAADKIAKINEKALTPADKFDFDSYYANISQQGVSAWEKVGLKEQEEQAKAKKLYDEKKISYQELQKALSTIHSQANAERMAIEGENQRKTEEQEKADVESYKKALAEKAKASAEIEKQITEAKAASAVTPEQELAALAEKISAENALTLQGKQEQLANGLIAKQQYDALEIALEEQKAAKLKELRDKQTAEAVASYSSMLGSASSAFGGIASAMSAAGKENSKEYKAMFAVSKAFALAQAGLNFSLSLSAALASAPWPANMAAMAQVAATAAPLISQIASAAYGGGRRNGGPTEANTMYQVNESGVPEMWTASNGKEYMMTGSQSGSVTSASKLNSGVQITINNNASGVDVTANASDDGKIVTIAVNRAVAAVADQIANNSGTVWNAMKAGTTTTGRTR